MKLFLFLLLMAFSLYASEYALLQKISDGDTFSFKSSSLGEYKCRIYGIDTPEKFSSKKLEKDASKAHISFSAMQEVGTKATEYAHKVLMLGNKYKVDTFGEDQYKRMLCVIHLQNGSQ